MSASGDDVHGGRRVGPVLIDEQRLQARVEELAVEIRRDTSPSTVLHLLTVLKGGFVFLADLARALDVPVSCDFLAVSSYEGNASSGQPRVAAGPGTTLADRDVLIVEDILDTGRTLAAVQDLVRDRRPRSLRTVALLDKPARRVASVTVDYTGFTIADRFVVGYGLDFEERFRNLPYVAVLETDE